VAGVYPARATQQQLQDLVCDLYQFCLCQGEATINISLTMLPTNHQHQLTVTNRYGAKVRGTVVYVQRIANGTAEVHFKTLDWLDPYRTPATYSTATQSVDGFYMPHAYELVEKHGWLFKGTFERAKTAKEPKHDSLP
jgi:hypothetical protein